MAGWLFIDAPLDDGELLIFRRVAVLRKGRRKIGGEVNVTDRRLLFVPNRLEQLVRATSWSVPLDDVDHVTVVEPPAVAVRLAGLPGMPKARAEIETTDGLMLVTLDDAAALAQLLEQPR